MNAVPSVSATLSAQRGVSASLAAVGSIRAVVEKGRAGDGAPIYDGVYDVTPRLSPQTLDTQGKLMREDVEVYGIPTYRTSNVGGGYTVVIAQD